MSKPTTRVAYVLTADAAGYERFAPGVKLPTPGSTIGFTYAGTTTRATVVTCERVSDTELGLVLEMPADHPYVRGLRKTGRSERGV